MPPAPLNRRQSIRAVLVTGGALVYAVIASDTVDAKPKDKKPEPSAGAKTAPASQAAATTRLPPPVEDMLDLIRAAIRSGDIEDLRPALQWNELPPEIADIKVADPIAHWRQISGDGQGREILAVLSVLLDGEPAAVPLGRDIENNRTFVWPAVAERPIKTLSPSEQVALLRLVPFAEARRMTEAGRYDGWRLMIGADGTWHSFKRG
jgi:hypothetical protein